MKATKPIVYDQGTKLKKDIDDEVAASGITTKTRILPSVAFAPEPPKSHSKAPIVMEYKVINKTRDREAPPVVLSRKIASSPPSLEDIANVLNEIHEVGWHFQA